MWQVPRSPAIETRSQEEAGGVGTVPGGDWGREQRISDRSVREGHRRKAGRTEARGGGCFRRKELPNHIVKGLAD